MPKIVIVDDDFISLETLQLIFQTHEPDYEIYKISSAWDGYEQSIRIDPDLVIADWEMPQMSGIELVEKIKAHPVLCDTPVIMITGIMMSSENLKKALASGANDFIRKPFDQIELVARVRSMLTLSKTIRELNQRNRTIAEQNRFTSMLIDSVPHPMVYYSPEGIILGCNKKFEDWTQLTKLQIIGSEIYSYWAHNETEMHRCRDLQLFRTGGVDTYEYTTEGGLEFILTKTIYTFSDNKMSGLLCLMNDVTLINEAHNQMVEGKKRELATSALRLIQMGELNNKLIADLTTIGQYANERGNDLIRGVISSLEVATNDNQWKEFEARFENVYNSFYQRLADKHPDLTPGERKLCALLRLNLTSKEIAAIIFQNPQSVDIARYRVRKKLNLAKDMNLVTYFENI